MIDIQDYLKGVSILKYLFLLFTGSHLFRESVFK